MVINTAPPEVLACLLGSQLKAICAVITSLVPNLKHEVAALVVDFGYAWPVVVANFGFIPEHNHAAWGEPQEVLRVVFANHWVQVHPVHVQPLDFVQEVHLGNRWNLAPQPSV